MGLLPTHLVVKERICDCNWQPETAGTWWRGKAQTHCHPSSKVMVRDITLRANCLMGMRFILETLKLSKQCRQVEHSGESFLYLCCSVQPHIAN